MNNKKKKFITLLRTTIKCCGQINETSSKCSAVCRSIPFNAFTTTIAMSKTLDAINTELQRTSLNRLIY